MTPLLILPDSDQSGQELVNMSAKMAATQLIICCQTLAMSEYWRFNTTNMVKKDGSLYARVHGDHPVVGAVTASRAMWELCRDVALGIAAAAPNHASGWSLMRWLESSPIPPEKDKGLVFFVPGGMPYLTSCREAYARVASEALLKRTAQGKT